MTVALSANLLKAPTSLMRCQPYLWKAVPIQKGAAVTTNQFSTGSVLSSRSQVDYMPISNRSVPAILLFSAILLLLGACSNNTEEEPVEADPVVATGERLFKQNCSRCHSLKPDQVITGPSLAGVATRASDRLPDSDAREYIFQSITDPGSYVVDGFPNVMPPNFQEELEESELDAIITFLLTLE